MFNNRSLKAAFLLTIFLLASFAFPVAADDGDGSLWGEVLNADGTIRYDNLTDQGVQTESADWMPSIDLGFTSVDMQAEYHVYETPSGNIVQLPTAATLFFYGAQPSGIGTNGSQCVRRRLGQCAIDCARDCQCDAYRR